MWNYNFGFFEKLYKNNNMENLRKNQGIMKLNHEWVALVPYMNF